jgi:hypothetical protein
MFQPSTKVRGEGASLGSPSRAPVSAQVASFSMSASDSEGSLRNLPIERSACHGGIFRVAVATLIALAQGRTWL